MAFFRNIRCLGLAMLIVVVSVITWRVNGDSPPTSEDIRDFRAHIPLFGKIPPSPECCESVKRDIGSHNWLFMSLNIVANHFPVELDVEETNAQDTFIRRHRYIMKDSHRRTI
ncbi:hypothetical protein BVC80_1423g3 [Macleaya cordata]|uniref:Uncharacterized protein n=1 Tax=Macleaya cordata TaxID=56857 RepID=A0A200Q8M5_MACCD|nr:hypothetical protein BVC80_1423g3 [Macleaya cordata]